MPSASLTDASILPQCYIQRHNTDVPGYPEKWHQQPHPGRAYPGKEPEGACKGAEKEVQGQEVGYRDG